MTLVLGIESSCDDTAAAVVEIGDRMAGGLGPEDRPGLPVIRSNEIWTESARHEPFGGVVPEIAARSHVEKIGETIRRALAVAGVNDARAIDLVAATAGPGLIGGVMVGLTTAKGLALALGKPLAPVNHLEGHALTPRLTDGVAFPYLLLLVSGGHTQFVLVRGVGDYQRIGTTIDDAAGEAFDKTAKLLGLPQPGGPSVEALAKTGRPDRYRFPQPLQKRDDCDVSLSGLKTAVRLAVDALAAPTLQDAADIALGFQSAIAHHLGSKTTAAIRSVRPDLGGSPTLVVAGGVAANETIKTTLQAACREEGVAFVAPPPRLCADNGAMIAWAGYERWRAGLLPSTPEAFAFAPRSRWPLAPPPVGREHGGGKRGPKA